MMRILLLTALLGLVSANFQAQQQQPNPIVGFQRHHHHSHHPHIHRHHPHHRPQKIVAIDQLAINKRPGHFLGVPFIRAQLNNQPEGRKYLSVTGKEERDVNGTIAVNQRDVIIDVSENKDGNFVVKDRQQHVVGSVELHGSNAKHINIHKHRSGFNEVSGSNTGAGVINIEQDLPTNRFGPPQPRRHMQVHLEQNHDTHASIHFTKLRPQPKYQVRLLAQNPQPVHRFRREAPLVEQPCSENGCLTDVVA